MYALQAGTEASFLLFVVLPGVALAAAIGASVYEIYRIGERRLLILVAILLLMFQHQVLEANAFLRAGEAVAEGIGEVFETGANLIAAGSVYYVLRFARRERRLVREFERNEQRYRDLIERAPVPILFHGPEEIRYANDAAVELFDADDRSALVGGKLSEYLDGKHREQVRASVLADGGTDVVESRLRTLEDRTRHATLTGAPADYEGEDVRQVVVQDLTEQRRREREFEQIFNSVNDGIIVWDPETLDILDANDAYFEMLGYDDTEALREQGVDGLSATEEGYTAERGMEVHQRVAETGESELLEWQGETRNGKGLWLEVTVTPAVIGGEDRTVSINRDVTERKLREQRLEVFNRILRHNLRNQVDVITSHAEALSGHTDDEHAGRIIAAADRLAEIGHRAREIDRAMSREPRESPVDIADLVDEVLDSHDRSDPAVSVTVDTPGSARLVTDREVLGAVLENAVDNALDYADSTVAVTVERVPDGYRIDVDDDGPGIPDEELVPLDSGTETDLQHGRGLGLWQLKWGLTKLNGDLAFDTTDGTTVRMTVPDLRAE